MIKHIHQNSTSNIIPNGETYEYAQGNQNTRKISASIITIVF